MPVPCGDVANGSCWSEAVQQRLEELKIDLDNEEITRKGFWSKKYNIVEEFLTAEQKSKAVQLRADFKAGSVTDDDFYLRMEKLLVPLSDKAANNTLGDPVDEEEKENKPVTDNVKTENFKDEVKTEDMDDSGTSSPASKRSKRSCTESKKQQSIQSMFAKLPAKKKAEDEAGNETKRIKLAPLKRCNTCRQNLNNPDLVMYENHPDGAREEFEVLFDPKIFMESSDAMDHESKPSYNVVGFTVYDKEGHVVRFDTDLIEKGKSIYMSGYAKAIYDQDPGIEGGLPFKDVGPLVSWWSAGFDGGDNVLLGVSSELADYILGPASELYRPSMLNVQEKVKRSIPFK